MHKPGFWKSFVMFEGLGPEVLAAVAEAARAQRWVTGEALFRRDEPGDWLVAIGSGRVRVSLVTAGGRELVLRHAEAGEMLGELALFDGQPRSADAVAAGEVRGMVLNRRDFLAIAARHPSLWQSALGHLAGMLRATTLQLESIALYQLRARVARFLLITLEQLHGDEVPEGAALALGLSQGELAAVLGATRPKVNRVLQEFRDEGLIDDQAGVWRCAVAALRAEAEAHG